MTTETVPKMPSVPAVAEDSLLRRADGFVGACDRCGACLPVCPLFGVDGIETASARGKNSLVRAISDGVIAPGKQALKAANFCLLCRACVENCPGKVQTDEAMMALRRYLIEKTGDGNWKYRMLGAFLARGGLVSGAAAMLSFLRRVGLAGIFPRELVPDAFGRSHFFAATAGPAVLGQGLSSGESRIGVASKIAFFRGCGMRMFFPEVVKETRRLLESTGRIEIRPNVCCGLPHLAHGLPDTFLKLARRNLRLYGGDDLIVTDCASCGSTLKNLARFFTDERDQEEARIFGRKVMDFSEYLVATGYRTPRKAETVFTYHDPCHLVRGQGITVQPRALLQAAGEFRELPDAGVCCGGAGSFHLDYPEIAASILEKKSRNIEATGAAVVVTGCPGCLIRLTQAARTGGKFQALHISQVI